jgi:hypoxanthine phosphoribosyltransferase
MADPPFPGARRIASPAEVQAAWSRLAAAIQPHVDEGACLLLGVMLGGMVPLVKISERLRGDFLVDYCHVTRYRGGTSGGTVEWVQRPRADLRGLTVVVVDDIFDEGHTLLALRHACVEAGARRVLVAVLAHKQHGRALPDIAPDFIGITVADEYVFGCGMDYQGRWRHLDAIFALPAAAGAR